MTRTHRRTQGEPCERTTAVLADGVVAVAAGRQAVALEYGRTVDPKIGKVMRDQWLIDPRTYRIVGMRLVSGDQALGGDSLVATAVVDEAGERG
ncbi:hypothetical protein [Streptomyces sp. MAI_2237]